MRNRRIRVLHEGAEYFLVDRGRTRASRVITFLRPLGKDDEPSEHATAVRVRTDLGRCETVASWSMGQLSVEHGHEPLEDAFRGIVERYLEEFRTGRRRTDTRTYHFLSVDRLPLYALSNAHPTGLSVLIFRNEDDAKEAAAQRQGIEARNIRVEHTQDLHDFLCARATDGFGGALLDEHDPIYFCLDDVGAPRFLRLAVEEESGQLAHELLRADGEWESYDGEQEIIPHLDQEIVDRHMVDRLGETPFFGYHDHIELRRILDPLRPGEVISVSADDDDSGAPSICPLFHDVELAASWLHDHELDRCKLVPVEDVPAFVDQVAARGCVLQLQPGAHHARGGAMWTTHGRVILDSFSGLWSSTDGRSFHIEAPPSAEP